MQIQEFCYDNQNFLKCFNKIILLFYKTEVLSEEVILKWYKDGHAPKGWTVFMDQMKKFVEWLEQAESGNLYYGNLPPAFLTHRLFSQHFAMGWLTYIGLRAQRLGSSLGAVFTLGEPPDLHPWMQVQRSTNLQTLETSDQF